MGKSKRPRKLVDLAAFWRAQGGRNLGITGDANHIAAGFSYHLGKVELKPNASSAKLARDKAGLSDFASAIDLGKLQKSLPNLRAFSRWLVAQCLANPAVRRDIREIIYTADGKTVQRYDGTVNKIRTGAGQGDDSHLKHTHISYFRDSEKNDKVGAFLPFFEAAWAPTVAAGIQAMDPSAKLVALAIRRAGHDFGTMIDTSDLAAALKNIGHDFGGTVNTSDVKVLLDR